MIFTIARFKNSRFFFGYAEVGKVFANFELMQSQKEKPHSSVFNREGRETEIVLGASNP